MVRINEHIAHIDLQEIPSSAHFRYLWSVFHQDGEIKEDDIHRIRCRSAFQVYMIVGYPWNWRKLSTEWL